MKKTISYLILALMISVLLCGCGNVNDGVNSTYTPSPSATAIIPSNIPDTGTTTTPGILPSMIPEASPTAAPSESVIPSTVPEASASVSPSAGTATE